MLVYIFFEKGGVPVGRGAEGGETRCMLRKIVTVDGGGGAGVSKVKDGS